MNTPAKEQLYKFLTRVDTLFAVPLSQKQDLNVLAQKFFEKATICAEIQDNEIIGMVAGYTESVQDGLGYISVVAVLPEHQGKGISKLLVNRFLEIGKAKNLKGVHLYTTKNNISALNLYKSIGFVAMNLENEPRPNDVHLIFNFSEDFKWMYCWLPLEEEHI